MRTVEVDFPEKAHISVLGKLDDSRSTADVEVIAALNGGVVSTVTGRVSGLERLSPKLGGPTVKIELRTSPEGAEVEYTTQAGRNRDFPPSIAKLERPGANYPILIGDPTGDRMIVSKVFVVVR